MEPFVLALVAHGLIGGADVIVNHELIAPALVIAALLLADCSGGRDGQAAPVPPCREHCRR